MDHVLKNGLVGPAGRSPTGYAGICEHNVELPEIFGQGCEEPLAIFRNGDVNAVATRARSKFGDRFIVRQFSPVITIGGGVVLDASESAQRAKLAERLAFVKAVEATDTGTVLLARVARRGTAGLSLADAVAEMGWLPARVQETSAQLQKAGKITPCNGLLITVERFTDLRRQALAAL